jgi:inorganic pyrophosphatase
LSSKIPIGKDAPEKVNVFIEIPQGGQIKYEVNEETGALFVDRFLYTSMSYPFNYGFICGTKGEDGDPLDAIVLSSMPVQAGVVLPSQPIGLLEMEDEEGVDTKIIAVPTAKIDPYFGSYKDVKDLPEMVKSKIKHFFEHYKELEPGKWVKLKNWKDANTAKKMIKEAMV